MNGLTFIALIAIAVGIVAAYLVGAVHGRRAVRRDAPKPTGPSSHPGGERVPTPAPDLAERSQLRDFDEDRRRLFGDLANARADTARYRQIVVDIEHNAPPPLLDAPGTPDDLKAIVGVGPVIERMLYQMGIATYRQIARWSERDIDEIDAMLPEFPGRIRRDTWVTQARELHLSKYGKAP